MFWTHQCISASLMQFRMYYIVGSTCSMTAFTIALPYVFVYYGSGVHACNHLLKHFQAETRCTLRPHTVKLWRQSAYS